MQLQQENREQYFDEDIAGNVKVIEDKLPNKMSHNL